MKLHEGVYENLITGHLQASMNQATDEGLVCMKAAIDTAETPTMLADHIRNMVANRLSDENLTVEERVHFANRLIEYIGEADDFSVVNERQMLSSVVSKQEEAELRAMGKDLVRPLTGFRTSSLFTGGQGSVPLNAEIERDIESADNIYLIVSFLKMSGLNLIYDKLKRFCQCRGHKLRVITTTYCGVTEAKAVERLAELPNTEIRISYNARIERLHAKSYIFERDSGFSTAYIGSSNLSKSAQTDGLEWNVRVTNVENPHIIKAALATFNLYWNSHNFEDYRLGGAEKLYNELDKERQGNNQCGQSLAKYELLPHQKQILERLAALRVNGVSRNLVVAATGTGKTVISAFDYKLFSEGKVGHHAKLLFIAHRQEILQQARNTYRSVMNDANFGELWTGQFSPRGGIGHLFISVQTFNSKYDEVFSALDATYYNYIVIDEAHHLVAESYRKVIEHFTPQILLGLTATPERMDGVSLKPDFENQISAEIRLPKALDEGLLTPFQYLCISDNTDLTDDELMQGNKYVATKITARLCNNERVSLIIDRLRYYLPDENRCKALAFCATKEHARYMAERFRACGLKADYLTADRDSERDTLKKQLSSGHINYLFVVDMFNEGIDIPAVDTVLFLRPTESPVIFMQQLGRGLRLYPGKQLLTVFDFVAQLNQKYDYASRFRNLLTHTESSIIEQVKNGFTFLPHGCTIHMEEKAQQYVLDNIKRALYDKRRLVRELSGYDHVPTLGEFVESNGQDVRVIYRANMYWTQLKREAGLCDYQDDAWSRRIGKGIGNLLHVNSLAYLSFVHRIVLSDGPIEVTDDCEEAYVLMLYYALFQESVDKLGFKNVAEALQQVRKYPLLVKELVELVDYLMSNIDVRTFSVGEGLPPALEQYARYTREEVFTIFGRQTANKKMRGCVSGVFAIKELNTELLFVTLNKSDKDFSPSTMYDDYVVSETQFHWKSQNTDTHEGRGKRFVEQSVNKKKFVLFVRESKRDAWGNTSSFYCFGLVDYICSRDDRPMSIDWRMHQPILPQFVSAV